MEKQEAKYLTIEAYLKKKWEAEKTFKGIYDDLEKAIKNGIKATGTNDLSHPKMQAPEARIKYENAAVHDLVVSVRKHFNIKDDLKNPINEALTLSLYLNIDRLKVREAIESLQEQANLENMINEFRNPLNELRKKLVINTMISLTDPGEVVEYTHTKGRVNMMRLGCDQEKMAYLVETYEKEGAVGNIILEEMGLLQKSQKR